MKTGKSNAWLVLALPVLWLGGAGCAKDRASVEKNLMADRNSAERSTGVQEHYRTNCPDVIELQVEPRPEFSGRYPIGPDGKIDLKDYGKLRIEGHTLAEIARLMAQEVGLPAESVKARVAEFHSAYVILFGEVNGWQRSIPYQGQETVLDLLQRVGGITVGAEPKDVYVVRPRIGESLRPEVFHVDLQAIVVKNDHKTNIRIMPFDQIYVGQTTQAQVERALPPWLRELTQTLWDTRPNQANGRQEPPAMNWVPGGDKVTR